MTPKKPRVRGPHGRLHAFVPIDILDDAKKLAKRLERPLDEVVSAALRMFLISTTETEAPPFKSEEP